MEPSKRSMKFYGRYGILFNNTKTPSSECCTTFWSMTIYSDTLHRSGITLSHDIVTELHFVTEFDQFTEFREISIEHLRRLWHANRGRLLHRTPGLVPF